VAVQPVPWRELEAASGADSSPALAERIRHAHQRQRSRAGSPNAELPDRDLDALVAATPDGRALLGRAVAKLTLSARAARRVLKVARTIADLDGEPRVSPAMIAEALGYRDGLDAC
jgi:magnesium chelatase family protein